MNIYEGLKGLEGRLGKRFKPWHEGETKAAYVEAPYLLIVHAASQQRQHCSTNLLPMWKADPGCKGVLFVAGASYGGFNEEERADITKKYGRDWVHFFSHLVGRNGPAPSGFSVFEKRLNSNVVDWDVLDPEWPPNLVGLLLLSRVVSLLRETNQSSKLALLCDSSPDGFKGLRSLALTEYKLHEGEDFGDDSPCGDSAGALASKIERFFGKWRKERGIVLR